MVDSSPFAGRTVTEVVPIDRVFVQLNTRNTGPHLARKVRGGIVIAFLHRNVEMPLLRSSHCCTLLKRIFHMASSFGCDFWCSAVQVVSKSRLSLVAGLGAWQGKAYTCLHCMHSHSLRNLFVKSDSLSTETFSHCATITGPGRGGNLKTQAVRSCCPVQADKRICAIYGLPVS